ncbi:MAG: 4-hydroxy-tetrahydrodipicolinate reductase [Clostridiales bacterium]|nr:4-hydroxy-tetrahydrodipicolinate reductase [Clostridiales bacterium]
MINILLNGCNGKMGQEIVKQSLKNANTKVVAGIDKTDLGDNKFPVYTNPENITENIDVIIDFSIPEASMNILKYAKGKHIPIVIATTGFNEEQINIINETSKQLPVFKSSNMSLGINLMIKLICEAAKTLENDYDIEIIEKHHKNKIDAPSGTALMMANAIKDTLTKDVYYEYNRQAKREKRNDNEIGIHAIRGGNIVGEHTVLFAGENETLEITHNVTSRSIFADGALKASEFIVSKENGLYSMNDLV